MEQASAPPASCNPCPPRGGGRSIRQGAPRAAGRSRTPSPSRPRRPPAPKPGPGAGSEPRWRRREARPEEAPCPQGQSRLRTPLPHLPKKASRRPSAQRHLQGRDSVRRGRGAPRLCSDFRREAPSPLARPDARPPAALGVQAPPLGCHQAPGPAGSHLRAVGRGLRPSRRPPRPAYPRAPGAHSPPTHPLCDQRRLAAGAEWLPKENRAGCPPGHPRPSISGGDPCRAGTLGREQGAPALKRGGLRLLSRHRSGPVRRAGVAITPALPWPTLPRPILVEPTRCNAAILTPCSPLTNRGEPSKRSSCSQETLCPRRRRPLCSPVLESPRPGHRITHAPALRLPRIFHRGEKNPSLGSAPGARPRPAIFKSNQSPH